MSEGVHVVLLIYYFGEGVMLFAACTQAGHPVLARCDCVWQLHADSLLNHPCQQLAVSLQALAEG
jgi:hypothetical protein